MLMFSNIHFTCKNPDPFPPKRLMVTDIMTAPQSKLISLDFKLCHTDFFRIWVKNNMWPWWTFNKNWANIHSSVIWSRLVGSAGFQEKVKYKMWAITNLIYFYTNLHRALTIWGHPTKTKHSSVLFSSDTQSPLYGGIQILTMFNEKSPPYQLRKIRKDYRVWTYLD